MLSGMGKQLKFCFLVILTTLMVLTGSILQVGEPLMAVQPSANCQVSACSIAIADQLYKQYPNIPKIPENNTTLLSRFIDYHLHTQERPARFHIDWELSMADYLDAPYDQRAEKSGVANNDKLAMHNLRREQRHELVRSLEQYFST
ncbi:MAG: hypothetical protein F6K11_00040 [Leptolyngbya sp. SIO3F4]|nr:hypothetical protein [Leptolyngbya sp. SIO3F4]